MKIRQPPQPSRLGHQPQPSRLDHQSQPSPLQGNEDEKIADKPFISFTSAELRNKYRAPGWFDCGEHRKGTEVHLPHRWIDEIDGFRTFKHDIPYESRTTEYESASSSYQRDHNEATSDGFILHKNLKTVYAEEAEKWLKMMKGGVRVFDGQRLYNR